MCEFTSSVKKKNKKRRFAKKKTIYSTSKCVARAAARKAKHKKKFLKIGFQQDTCLSYSITLGRCLNLRHLLDLNVVSASQSRDFSENS